MANTETTVSNLKINRLTQTQLENASSLSNTEAYWVDPEFQGDKILVTDSNGDIVEGNTAVIDGSSSMPSSTYDDLTLGATGSTYTAPANGWFTISQTSSNNSGMFCSLTNTSNGVCNSNQYYGGTDQLKCSIPVAKGQTVLVTYYALSTEVFRFVYAEGDI